MLAICFSKCFFRFSFLLLLIVPVAARAQDPLPILFSELEKNFDPKLKVRILHEIGDYYVNVSYQMEEAEKYLQEAVKIAELSESTELKRFAYTRYLSTPEIGQFPEKTMSVISKLKALAEVMNDKEAMFECWKVIGKSCKDNDLPCGDEYADKALIIAANTSSRVQMMEANILKAMVACSENQWHLAFNFFAEAELQVPYLDVAPNTITLQWLYREMAHFFKQLGDMEQAKSYHQKLMELMQMSSSVDSVALAFQELISLEYSYRRDPTFPVIPALDGILQFAVENDLGRLKHFTLSFYRTYLIEREDLSGFRHLFLDKAPNALKDLRKNSEYHFHSIQAFLMESEGKVDSARVQWGLALNALETDPNSYLQAHGEFRMAQFYLRNKERAQATKHLENAFQIAGTFADIGHSETLRKQISHYLKNTYESMGDFESALKYGNLYHEYDHLSQQRLDKNLIVRLGVHERELDARIQEIKDHEKKLKYNLQYWIILILVFALFLVLIIASSMRVPKWVIQMIAFFSILAMVEFILILLDKQVMYVTQGAPLGKFFFKVGILTFLYPLHHLIEHKVTDYMLKHQLFGKPSWKDFKKSLGHLWPWLRDDEEPKGEGH